jgi:hypothetical protein
MLEFAIQRSQLASRAKTTLFARRQFGVLRYSAKIAGGDFGQ